jgi:iron(III) transport system substrate-binding protein
VVTGDFQELLDKVHKPGPDPAADLFISDNVADLWSASEQDVFRPTRSDIIDNRVPGQLRDPEHLWTSISVRTRTVVYNTELLSSAEIETVTDYTSLTAESWRERVCLSSSRVRGNALLIAMLINDNGVRETEAIVRGWRANFALPVFENDAKLLQAIAAGQCAIGIADSNEIAGFLQANANGNVAPHWFAQAGVLHINASGAGVTRHTQNPDGAAALLEWLTSESANGLFAALRLEFPANTDVTADAAISAWAGFDANPANLASLGYSNEEAILLAERARYR